MWNYEAVIKETDDKLIADDHEPLYAVYPEDGMAIADSPLVKIGRLSVVPLTEKQWEWFLS